MIYLDTGSGYIIWENGLFLEKKGAI